MVQEFVLTYGALNETLTINPEGWSENGQSWQRDKIYHGVFQSYTVSSFRFALKPGGGGDFIKNAYDTDDIKANVIVTVSNRNPQTDDFDISYIGKLNFDPEKFFIERDYVEVGFVQNSNIQKFTNRDETELDITKVVSLDDVTMNSFVSQPVSIAFKPINIWRRADLEGNFDHLFYISVVDIPELTAAGIEFHPASTYVDVKYYAENIPVNEIGLANLLCTAGPLQADRVVWIYENPHEDTYCYIKFESLEIIQNARLQFLDYSGPFDPYARVTVSAAILIVDSSEVTLATFPIFTKTIERTGADPWPYTEDIDFNFDDILTYQTALQYFIPPGGKLAFFIEVEPYALFEGAAVIFSSDTGSDVPASIDFNFTIYEVTDGAIESNVNCFYPHEAFTRLFQLITSEEDTFYSTFFGRSDSEFITYSTLLSGETGKLDAITSGWNLRQFSGKPLTINLRKLFEAFDSMYNLMLGYDSINERFYIERKSNAFDRESVLFDIGEIIDLKINPYNSAYFNEISGGCDTDGNYEEFQGVNEFISKIDFTCDQPVKETLKIRCPYNTDSIAMELARRMPYSNFASEDTDYDDKIFIVRTNSAEETVQGGASVSGFAGIEDRYNIKLTARESLLRWADYIKCSYWKQGTFTIKFGRSSKVVDIIYENQFGEVVSEFDDIESSEIEDVLKLFNPRYYQFTGKFMPEYKTALELNPHGIILFTFDNESFAGFVDHIQTKDYDRQAEYKLIAYDSFENTEKWFMDDDTALFMDDDTHLFE